MFVELDNIIIDTFKPVLGNIVDCKYDRVVLKGGRGSTKSQFASESILIGCMSHKQSAVCMLKHGNKIKDRLVDTFSDSIKYLNIEKWWKLRKSPHEYVLLDKNGKETNVSIKFTGCDDPKTIKSFRARAGTTFRYIWFEEITDFSGLSDINTLTDTMSRGAGDHCVIMSYNPPKSTSSWVNKEYNKPCGTAIGYESDTYEEEISFKYNDEIIKSKQLVHHSTYLDVVESGHSNWLEKSFLANVEQSKNSNKQYYEWNYLGKIVGTEANVFTNICNWKYTEDINITEIDRGLDCSHGGPDPWAFGNWFYDRRNHDLYCLDEFKLSGDATLEQVASNIIKVNKYNMNFYIDSSVPTFKRLLLKEGVNPIGVKKYPDSVIAGILWLQSLNHIYIDSKRTPNTYKEFKEYEYLIDKNDEVTSELVDKNNHFIDACRYALCYKIKNI